MAFGGGYGAGTLGSLAFGGAQTNNLAGGQASGRRGPARPRPGGGTSNYPYQTDPNGRPYQSYPRPGIDYPLGGIPEPTWPGIFEDWIFGREKRGI